MRPVGPDKVSVPPPARTPTEAPSVGMHQRRGTQPPVASEARRHRLWFGLWTNLAITYKSQVPGSYDGLSSKGLERRQQRSFNGAYDVAFAHRLQQPQRPQRLQTVGDVVSFRALGTGGCFVVRLPAVVSR